MGMMINRRRAYGGKKGLPYGAVDMGLPSGTLWAQGNIVKDAQDNYAIGEPTDYGCYFSWGNIDGHNAGDGYSFDDANYALTSGSQLTGNIQSDDALHDAAAARIGGGWHMPTVDNFSELFNTNYTIREWISLDGVNGYLLTSITNNNQLFMPVTGFCSETGRYNLKNEGNYWTNRKGSGKNAYRYYILQNTVIKLPNSPRRNGYIIRPVHNLI